MVNNSNQSNPNNTNKPEKQLNYPEKLQQLLTDFGKLQLIKNSIYLEYELLEIAKKYDFPLDSVRQMFKDYLRQKQDEIWQKNRLLFLLYCIEKALEIINESLKKMDLFPVLEHLSKLSILVALIVFVIEIPERAEQRAAEQTRTNYEAWGVILSNEGKPASGGRVEALQNLNQQNIPLTNINLSGAFLSDIQLPNAQLDGAILNNALLNRANLEKSYMINTKLEKVAFINANLKEANFFAADLSNAVFREADLTKASLTEANLDQADFREAQGLTISQIKQAKNWQTACYDLELQEQLAVKNSNCK